jgi:pilus assembly protein Flp/PilA
MVNQVLGFMNDEEGPTAIEYGLLAALIAAVIVGIVGTLGTTLQGVFTNIDNQIGAGGS